MKESAGGAEDPREKCERGDIDYVDQAMARALAHPMRIQILAELNKGNMSPSGFAKQTGEKVPNVSYHFRVLAKYDCIEEVETKMVRGAVEHFYQATKRVLFDGKSWGELPQSVRAGISGQAVDDFLRAIAASMAAELFDSRSERMLVWVQKRLDLQGWHDAAEAQEQLLRTMHKIYTDASRRLSEAGEPEGGMLGTYAVFLFESPPPVLDDGDEQGADD